MTGLYAYPITVLLVGDFLCTQYSRTGLNDFIWVSAPERLHCKKRLAVFSSPAGMSLTKLSLAKNILIIPAQGGFGKGHPDWGQENRKLFLQCREGWPLPTVETKENGDSWSTSKRGPSLVGSLGKIFFYLPETNIISLRNCC